MDAVPAEILQEIVGYLSGPGLNSLRLVNRTLCAAANIFKFRALYVRATRKGLDHLLNVSRQPELARCVREITYPHDHLAPMQGPYFENLPSLYMDPSEFLELERLAMSFFDWYTEKHVVQLELQDSGDLQLELEKWRGTLNEADKAYVSELLSNFIWGSLLETELVKEGQEQATKAVMDLINTTHRLGFKLDRFGMDGPGVWCGFFSKTSGLWNCASLFQNLTSVYVCITSRLNTFDDIRAIKIYAKKGQLYQFISFAPNLRMLYLCIDESLFQNHEVEVNPEIYFLDILSHDYVWQHLHTFCLEFPNVNLEDLVEFLGRHARTLKCLLLWCTPVNGTWRKVMDCLKERLHLTDLD
ncbi:hypothetical protein RUND412_004312 [Rhizina undulata]